MSKQIQASSVSVSRGERSIPARGVKNGGEEMLQYRKVGMMQWSRVVKGTREGVEGARCGWQRRHHPRPANVEGAAKRRRLETPSVAVAQGQLQRRGVGCYATAC